MILEFDADHGNKLIRLRIAQNKAFNAWAKIGERVADARNEQQVGHSDPVPEALYLLLREAEQAQQKATEALAEALKTSVYRVQND